MGAEISESGGVRAGRAIRIMLLGGALAALPIVATPASDADSLAAEAQRWIDTGHLQRAIHVLEQALEIDSAHARALELRELAKQRYFERAGLLLQATELATVGRFVAADRKLQEAERIDSDHEGSLEMARDFIEVQRKEYYVHNPRYGFPMHIGLGSLGVDEDFIESRVDSVNPFDIGSSTPINIGLGWKYNFRHHLFIDLGGGYGFSRNDESPSREKDLVEFWQLTAGAGVRTIRTARKKYEFRISGGIGWETAKTNLTGDSGLDASDSQPGGFVRFGVGWKKLSLYLQRGVGFDEDPSPDSAIGWSNRSQFGIGYSF